MKPDQRISRALDDQKSVRRGVINLSRHDPAKIIDLQVEIEAETEKAVLVHTGDKDEAAWLPKSAIEIFRNDPIPGVSTISLPQKLAIEKGLV